MKRSPGEIVAAYKDRFGFLPTHCPVVVGNDPVVLGVSTVMLPVVDRFLVPLGLASSKSDLRELLGLIPEGCRLMREDVVKLEQFWSEFFYDSKPPQRQRVLPNEAVAAIFASLFAGWNLGSYYVGKLCGERRSPWTRVNFSKAIYWDPQLSGSDPSRQFQVQLGGVWLPFICTYLDSNSRFGVEIMVRRDILTEPLTHHLRTSMPIGAAGSHDDPPYFAIYYLEVSADRIADVVRLDIGRYTRGANFFAAPAFLDRIARIFRELKVPVEDVRPLRG